MHDPDSPAAATSGAGGNADGRSTPGDLPAGGAHASLEIDLRPVLALGGGLVMLLAIGAIVATWMCDVLAWGGESRPPASATTPSSAGSPAPAGLPLASPSMKSWAQVKAEQTASLHRTAWIDAKAGILQIPIERAMELIVERRAQADRAAGAGGGGEDQTGQAGGGAGAGAGVRAGAGAGANAGGASRASPAPFAPAAIGKTEGR